MRIATYNILAGGFNDYDHEAEGPQRLELVQGAVRQLGADVIALIDTFGWNKLYTQQQLQSMFGYEYAVNIPLDDKRLESTKSDRQIGVALLSNVAMEQVEVVDLGNRNALTANIKPENEPPLTVKVAYLDDLKEDVRLAQVERLLASFDTGERAILMGDLNSFAEGDRFTGNFTTVALGRLARTRSLPFEPEMFEIIHDMQRCEVVAKIKAAGLVDAAQQPSPTFPTRLHELGICLPIFRVDYVFHSPDLEATSSYVPKDQIYQRASDHFPVVSDFRSSMSQG